MSKILKIETTVWIKFLIGFLLSIIFDQIIKAIFLNGYRYDGDFFSLILVFNKGVAFSMLSFLGEWLKFLQVGLIVGIIIYLTFEKKIISNNSIAVGVLLGSGVSNIIDRFIHTGVVDYIFWHYIFEFAVFNVADALINISVAYIIIQSLRRKHG